MHVLPRRAANALPSTSARCCAATVKKLEPLTSSHKSYPVLFLLIVRCLTRSWVVIDSPVLSYIGQVILNDWPNERGCSGRIAVIDEPLRVRD